MLAGKAPEHVPCAPGLFLSVVVSTLRVGVAGTDRQSCQGYPVTGYTVVELNRIHPVGQNRTLPAGFHTGHHRVALRLAGSPLAVQSRIRQVVRPAGFHRLGIRRQVVHRRVEKPLGTRAVAVAWTFSSWTSRPAG